MDNKPTNQLPNPNGDKKGLHPSVTAASISAGAAIIGGLLASPVLVNMMSHGTPPTATTVTATAPTPVQEQLPAFEQGYTYKLRDIQRVEMTALPNTPLTKRARNFLRLTEVSFNTTGDKFKIELTIRNNESTPIMVDPKPDYFVLEDEHSQKANLLSMYHEGRELLSPGQERKVLFFYEATGWYGKTTAANYIYFRVENFDPIQRETWKMKTVPLAS
ncbi:MAG: hypothetical protein JO316_06085 [Abitibacteriaceae bacterium]|nr:hypothetical protein [Abditibacteriaceae bacterium]MBV9864899.1 hypothetical protein [Abditibacteriaceae bacterium]